MKNVNKISERVFKFLFLLMPVCLFLSFYPVIKLGESESMYFELSVAEIWLVLFDIVGFVVMMQRKVLFRDCRKWWVWMLLPLWITLSVAWSLNRIRGLLTAGMMWCVVMAVYTIWTLRDTFGARFREKWWKWFWGATLAVCAWCVIQCIMDLAGMPQSCSLLCDGCTYRMFGFPHPNGFAIEPQFMGNLLLAPAMTAIWLVLKKQNSKNLKRLRSRGVVSTTAKSDSALYCSTSSSSVAVVETTTGSLFLCFKFLLFCFFITVMTLFLTFSRGAIYAFLVGMLFMSGYVIARAKNRGVMWKRVGVTWGLVVGAFVVSLVGQGVMAEVSPTADTFGDGVAKVVNHLSLGIIDLKYGDKTENNAVKESVEKSVEMSGKEPMEMSGDSSRNGSEVGNKEEAVFDGYVAESTDTRVRLSGAAIKVWSSDVKTMAVGVGLGGAGQALYNNNLSPAPREIVQNEYASLLLETGLIGMLLAVVFVIFAIRWVVRSHSGAGLILSLFVVYGVSLVFFSGLPNVLHIYLMPIALMVMNEKYIKNK